MADAKETQNNTQLVLVDTEDIAVRAVKKRYEGLTMVRTKAIKGKGAWYWAHLEPILVRNPTTNLPKAVKLKCNLCESVFSASNPSRTASEHLKRGTCPNFNSFLLPSSSSSLPPLLSPSSHSNRKRVGSILNPNSGLTLTNCHHHHHQRQQQQHLVLSGGKDDLGPLAMLEDSVKKLKSPNPSPPGPRLTKSQIDSALGLLTDWFFESYGSVSFQSLDHPKFKAFMNQVGLPPISRQDFACSRLDSKYEQAKLESEATIKDAEFFQIVSDGWKSKIFGQKEEGLVKFMVNLPNGTAVFRKAVFTGGGGGGHGGGGGGSMAVPAKFAEEIMWDTITGTCCNLVQRCVGIVADKYKSKALRNLEIQHQWMVNLSCQLQGISDLIKDFSKELPLFKNVIDKCFKISSLFNNNSQARSSFNKFKSQVSKFSGFSGVLPFPYCDNLQNLSSIAAMVEDTLTSARVLQLAVMEDSYKLVLMEDPFAREVAEMIQNVDFWNDVEAIHTLIKLIREMAEEIESERPLVGQCLPLWEDLRAKLKDWCVKFGVHEGLVEKIIDKRFKKNYHPAWSTAFILDPVYLMREINGKYLPPFKCLTFEQEKDVEKLITRLLSRDEAHIALTELKKWRSEGLDPLYAQAVQVKRQDPLTGKMKIANPQSSRLVWETILKELTFLGKIAIRLLFLNATACGFKCNWSFMKWAWGQSQSQSQESWRVSHERVQKMIYIAANSKLKRREFAKEEEKDSELFAISNGEDDEMLDEVFVDAPTA